MSAMAIYSQLRGRSFPIGAIRLELLRNLLFSLLPCEFVFVG